VLVFNGLQDLALRRLKQHYEHNLWGGVSRWNKNIRKPLVTHLKACIFEFEVEQTSIQYSNYLYGLGHPQGEQLTEIFSSYDEWFEDFRTWLEALTMQDLERSDRPKSMQMVGSGLLIWTEPNDLISLPASANHIKLSIDKTLERYKISLPKMRLALKLTESGSLPPLTHILLRDSRAAFRRRQYRRAVIDAGSAVETCLKDYAAARGINLGARPMLGSIINNGPLQSLIHMPPNTQAKLVNTRNDAIHHNRVPSQHQTKAAISIATKIITTAEPLPRS